MYYTYILKSKKVPGAVYIGYTKDLKLRLNQHNSGTSTHSSKYTPWEVETYLAFNEEFQAKAFEKYLKSSSGKAFMRKRLISEKFKIALKKYNNGRTS
jgi:predicted GIY-YIG superfamily endonuclease